MTKQAGGLREDYVSAIAARKFPQAVKVLEKLLAEAQRPCTDQTASTLQLLCNRAQLYHRMGLSRKALKDYDEALALQPTCLQAAVGKGKVLYSLKKAQEAQKCWKDACNSAGPESDLTVLLEAHSLAKDPEAVLNPQPAASKPAPVANGLANGNAVHRAEPSASFGPSTPQASAPSSSHKAPITGPARPPSAAWANTNPAAAVSVAVTQINAGKLPEAIALLDKVIAENKKPDLGAHVARGTARALRRELEAAIEDFSVAIELNPNFDDAYKRRGQARAALEQDKLALADLRRAVELSRTHQQKAEGHQEIGMLFQRQRDFRKATAEFQKVVEMDPTNAAAWNLLGLCRTSQGDIPAGLQAYEQAIKLNPKHREAWINMAQAKKEVGLVEEARVAFVRGTSLDSGRASQSVAGMRVLAQMWQGTGDHFKAVSVLDDALTRCKTGGATVDCLFLRAACNHALGFHLPAVQDYERALTVEGNTSDETKMQQFLAFYQKEMALYVRHNMDRNVADFCLDREIHPMFKESWCKKGPPTTELLMHYRMQPPPRPGPSPPRPSPAILGPLTAEADRIGALLQNRHSGFLPNKRQQRMGGLAAIELAQAVRHLAKH
ncbi:hypothetical protein WJX72_003273 [[Myrmecia] bisecta]|uniref:Uncharacterized protein n=1 Tax=[Myrmecia] bisecta TaxID=41462 RepID=A0AAW1QBQ1_9CHLO